MAALCGNAKFKAAVMEQMKSAGASAKLKGFEVVRDIHLEAELFSVDNDLLTPTFKLKRPQVCASYAPQRFAFCRINAFFMHYVSVSSSFPHPSSGQSQIPEANCGNVSRTKRSRSCQAPNCWCDVKMERLVSQSQCRATHDQSLCLIRVNLLLLLRMMLLAKQFGAVRVQKTAKKERKRARALKSPHAALVLRVHGRPLRTSEHLGEVGVVADGPANSQPRQRVGISHELMNRGLIRFFLAP